VSRRLAILPANVLLPDGAAEWLRVAIPLVLQRDLATSKNLFSSAVPSESAAYQVGAAQVLRTTLEERIGRPSLQATITNVATQQTRRVLSGYGTDFLSQANALAKQIDSRAAPFSTRSQSALQAFSIGVLSPDIKVKVQRLNDALVADPSFGLAYIVLAETLATAKSPEMALVLRNGVAHRNAFTALDRANFDFVRSRLLPAPLSEQASAGMALVNLAPNEPDVLAALAGGLFLEGNSAEAEKFMGHALAISPGNANLRQQLALGLIETRQFAKAEKVLLGLAANPAVLSQLAVCILFEGDMSRADSVYQKFIDSVADPDAKLFLRASWQALTGHWHDAVQLLLGTQFADPRFRSLGRSQAVIWQLLDRNYVDAKATSVGASPEAALLASGASSAEAWTSKLQFISDSGARETLNAYGLFLYGFYPQAAAAWKTIDSHSGGTNLRARTMLASSLHMAGREADAKKVPVQPFTPEFNDYYNAVSFTELRKLLGQAE
jgi:tetratricopeptide (TPR) repeat protein